MYENYTRQALPSREYRELLGSALCVFNSNNAFVIENILRRAEDDDMTWYELMDKTSGGLKRNISEVIVPEFGQEIADLFSDVVDRRNRIIHSFQITDKDGEQRLATKTREQEGGDQFVITEAYLLDFIKRNERLSGALYECRGY